LSTPKYFSEFAMDAARSSHIKKAVRAAQQQLELRRLLAHQQEGADLLCASLPEQRRRIAQARREVDRWEAGRLCSADYIERWRVWLDLPIRDLVRHMCSDEQGWGRAMRQNSPFAAQLRKAR
jgi:hypothetical protein